jgi:hypothetical protein
MPARKPQAADRQCKFGSRAADDFESRIRKLRGRKWRKQNRGSGRFCDCSVVSASATTSAVALEIAVVIAVPAMIMDDHHAAWTLPVSCVKRLSFVPGGDPARAGIRRARPVPVMPHVMAVHRIPVPFNPHELGFRRRRRRHVHHARRRRWTNLNSDRNGRLRGDDRPGDQQARGNKRCPSQSFHVMTSDELSATSDPTDLPRVCGPLRRRGMTPRRSTRVLVSPQHATDFNYECANRNV